MPAGRRGSQVALVAAIVLPVAGCRPLSDEDQITRALSNVSVSWCVNMGSGR